MDIYIARGEEKFGPYPLEQIRELLDQGALLPEDLAFHEGLDNWTPLAEVIAAQTAPKLPSPPLPAVLPPAQEESEAPETLPTGPSSGPQPASTTPTKIKKQVPLWVTIVVLLVVLGGLAGGAVWYVFFKPNPEEDDGPLLEDPMSMGSSSTSENQNTARPGGTTRPVIPPKPEPTPRPTPPSPSDPLARSILGKRLVCKTAEGIELILQFDKDGTFSIGTDWQGEFSQHREAVHYSIDNLKVKLSDNGRKNGDVTFPTDNPKEGDQISFGPEQKQITATILRIEPAKAFEISSNPSTGGDTATTEPSGPEPVIEPKKLTPAQVENILAQEIGSWKVKGATVTLDPKTGTAEANEFEHTMETRWKEKGKSTATSFSTGVTGTTEYDSEMEWFVWRMQGEGRPETVSKNIYDPATKTYHQLLMLPNDHVERGTFKRINKDEAILKSEVFNADNEVVATQEINFTRIDSDVTEPAEPTKKLTANQASEVMAWEIGSWEAKGQGQPAGGQPNPIAITREVRWKEEGKSLKFKFSLVENGKPVTYFGHQEYDAAMGVFVYRSKWGNNPETTSHDVYDVTTRTTQGRSMPAPSEGEPSTTTITKRVGDDRSEQTLEITLNGQVIYSHKIVSTRIKTAPIEKKLSPEEVEKILAAQIGQWQVKGQVKQAEGDPIPYEFRMDTQWKEKGESIHGQGSLEKNGQRVSLFSHKEYDPVKGVFLFRFRDELRPEVLSHEQYDPATQTFQGRQISPEESEVTYTFQADGPDKFIFKMKTTKEGELLSTDESVQTRIATTVTEPTQPTEPAAGGDDKSAKIIEAAIRKSINKPEGELTKADHEKVTGLNLQANQLTSVKGLEKLTHLTGLDLGRNQLTDVEGLEKLTKLEVMSLKSNKLTDVKGLEKLAQLEFLDLPDNQLTDVKGLEKLTKLKRLDLRQNPDLTKAQIDQLQKALPKCNILTNPK